MDISKVSTGAKLVLGGGIALLIVSFFSWFEVDGLGGFASMWDGIGFVAGLALLALLAWEVAQLAGVKLELGVSPALVTVALAVVMGVFVVLRFIITPGPGIADDIVDRTIWAWIGLLLAIVVVAGAVLGMQSAGKSFSDMRTEFSGAASSRGRSATPPPAPTTPPPADPPAAAPPTSSVDPPDDPPRTTP